jgi:uncharacterized membrane protein YeaQ/YmgE (transglycosylase-associated protein family)
MTATLISLISILTGIIGANLTAFTFKKHSFGIVGNSIAGVFGSIFFIKFFGRFGFDPFSIVEFENINFKLLTINLVVSFFGGFFALILLKKLRVLMNKD